MFALTYELGRQTQGCMSFPCANMGPRPSKFTPAFSGQCGNLGRCGDNSEDAFQGEENGLQVAGGLARIQHPGQLHAAQNCATGLSTILGMDLSSPIGAAVDLTRVRRISLWNFLPHMC